MKNKTKQKRKKINKPNNIQNIRNISNFNIINRNISSAINPFKANVPFLYSLKTSENLRLV